MLNVVKLPASQRLILIWGVAFDGAWNQLHPLVVPQDSQTKHDPAGRIRTPQVEQ
jgi:hypothetical protein